MQPYEQFEVISYSTLLVESFFRLTKQNLIEKVSDLNALDISNALYHLPFGLVSHGIQSDPIFRYANLKAQELWNYTWDEFIQIPSRFSAEPIAREERQKLLEKSTQYGYVDNYKGVRITKQRKRFLIENTLLWDVIDNTGIKHGQAALIKSWHDLA